MSGIVRRAIMWLNTKLKKASSMPNPYNQSSPSLNLPRMLKKEDPAFLIEYNGAKIFSSFNVLPNAELIVDEEKVLLNTGIRYPIFNGVFMSNFTGSEYALDAKVDDILTYFKAQDIPMIWWCGPMSEECHLKSRLQQLRLPSESLAGLSARIDDKVIKLQHINHFEVRRIKTKEGIEDYTNVFLKAYDIPEAFKSNFITLFEMNVLKGEAQWEHFVGYYDNNPVSVATIFYDYDTIGLYNVGTLPDFQRQHFATEVTMAAVKRGQEMGCRWVVGSSFEKSLKMYQHLGAEIVCDMTLFFLP